jgi:hypothetical protein
MNKERLATLALALVLAACGGDNGADEGAGGDNGGNDEGRVTGTDDVVAAFREAGLEAEDPRPMTVDDYGFAPYICDGTRFLIPSLGKDSGGRVFVCADEDDQATLRGYYEDLGEGSAALFSWVFEEDDVLVQINGELDEATARRYEAAIP